MELDHINISAPAELLESVKNFYCHVFKLSEGPRPDIGIAGYWLYAEDRPIVHLLESDRHVAVPNSHLDHVAFRDDDRAGIEQRLQSIDCAFDVLERPADQLAQLFFRDPAGIQLEANVPL